MLNLRNDSIRRVDVKLGAPVASGALTRTGGFVGVPMEHGVANETVAFIQEGIVALTLSIGGTLAAGCYLYWDVTNSLPSLGAGARDIELGQIIGADPDGGSGVYLVKMRVGYPRAAAGNAQATS